MNRDTTHKHLFPIIDAMVDSAIEEVEDEGGEITCKAGCTHCCHLLIEVAWEEAQELAMWVMDQPEDRKQHFLKKIQHNASEAKTFFQNYPKFKDMKEPISDERELDDTIYDDYFYNAVRPCPFLEDGMCSAYHSRPTSCRLHLVSSPPELCAASCKDDDDYDIPDEIEELKEHASHVLGAVEKDGRWGHFGIVVEAALLEMIEKEKGNATAVSPEMQAANS